MKKRKLLALLLAAALGLGLIPTALAAEGARDTAAEGWDPRDYGIAPDTDIVCGGSFYGSLDLMKTQGEALDYVLNIAPVSALDNVVRVKAVVKCFDVKNGETYVLGESAVDSADWTDGRFEHDFPETWYTINGNFASMDSGWSGVNADGIPYRLFRIPAFVNTGSGDTPVYVIAAAPEDRLEYLGDATAGNLDVVLEGFCSVDSSGSSDSITPLTELGVESFSFRPVLAGDLYDPKTWTAQDTVTVAAADDGFELELSKRQLNSGHEQYYAAYFQITDRTGGRILSEPIPFYVIESLAQLGIKPIPPQIYEGEAIAPKVTFLFMGHEVLTEGTDYTVAWSSNVEVGTATGVITSCADPGDTREVTFEICQERDWTRKYIEWMARRLPPHLPGEEFEVNEERWMDGYVDSPHDEYVVHSLLAEELKEVYEQHTDPADRKLFQESKLVSKMEAHYAAAMEGVKTTDKGVEIIGVLRLVGALLPYHAADGKLSVLVTDGAPDFAKSSFADDLKTCYEKARAEALAENGKVAAARSYSAVFMQRASVYEAADRLMGQILSLPGNEMTPDEIAEQKQEFIKMLLAESGGAEYGYMSLSLNGSDEGADGRPLTVTLKIPVPSGYDADTAAVYRVDGETAEKVHTCRAGQYLIFETDTMAEGDCWFTLFAVPKASGGSGGGSPSKPSVRPGAETVKPDSPTTTPSGGVAGFNDVASGAWYAEPVRYVVEKGLFGGVGNGNFAPDANMTRAMMWTVLARYMGVDTNSGSSWYEAARDWAVAQGISDGTMADGNVTREQFVTMLWRLSGGPAVESGAGFTDGGSVSGYARAAVDWAVSVGIVSGYNDGTFKPQGSATRAEVAKMLTVFCTNAEAG